MDIQQIEGIKYDLDRLSSDEIINMRGHLLETHARTTGEIALLEFKLFQHTNTPLPFDEDMGGYGEIADPETWAMYTEATREI